MAVPPKSQGIMGVRGLYIFSRVSLRRRSSRMCNIKNRDKLVIKLTRVTKRLRSENMLTQVKKPTNLETNLHDNYIRFD